MPSRQLSSSRRRFLLGLGAFLAAGRLVRAQQPVTTIHSVTRLVNVYVTVRDKKSVIVQNLKKDDFAIAEDGRPQTIAFFSHENDLPLTLGLLVDTSPSEANMIEQERDASRLFFDTVLDLKKDKAFLIHFDTQVELLQDLTNSLPKLDEALNKLDAVSDQPSLNRRQRSNSDDDDQEENSGQRGGPSGGGHGGGGSDDGGGSTHLFDAVYLASTQVLKNQTGRKALIIVGDGDDMGSKVTKSRAIRSAQQNDVLIYCIRIVDKDFGKQGGHRRFSLPAGIGLPGMGGPGMGGPGGGGPGGGGPGGGGGMDRAEGKKNLEALAGETGGALFEVSKKTSLSDVYAQIREELRSQYSLGYTPADNAPSGYRRIRVTVPKHGNYKVQAREGYYSDRD